MSTPSRRIVLLVQGGYYVSTGVLAFVSRRAFETVIGDVLLSGAGRRHDSPELFGLAAGSAAALAGVDVVYVARRRISPRYLADAAVQAALLGGLAAGRPR